MGLKINSRLPNVPLVHICYVKNQASEYKTRFKLGLKSDQWSCLVFLVISDLYVASGSRRNHLDANYLKFDYFKETTVECIQYYSNSATGYHIAGHENLKVFMYSKSLSSTKIQ